MNVCYSLPSALPCEMEPREISVFYLSLPVNNNEAVGTLGWDGEKEKYGLARSLSRGGEKMEMKKEVTKAGGMQPRPCLPTEL